MGGWAGGVGGGRTESLRRDAAIAGDGFLACVQQGEQARPQGGEHLMQKKKLKWYFSTPVSESAPARALPRLTDFLISGSPDTP